jgi:putative transcriptional regulator
MEANMAGELILEGLGEALAHSRGTLAANEHPIRVPDMIDVRAIRAALGLSQAQFALMFGFKLDTVRNWEQAKRVPNAQARVLLKIIDHDPDSVKKALAIA